MIEINLLPKELRKKKSTFKIPDMTFIVLPIAVGVIGLLVSAHLLLLTVVGVKKNTYKRLEKEWAEVLPKKQKVDAAKSEIQRIQRKVSVIDQLMVKRILWSKKLNDLGDAMIPGIWLIKLSLGERKPTQPAAPSPKGAVVQQGPASVKYLNLEGRAASTYGDETATVGRFITSLRENEGFFKEFSHVELEIMQRSTIKDIEVMDFRVSCYFKEGE